MRAVAAAVIVSVVFAKFVVATMMTIEFDMNWWWRYRSVGCPAIELAKMAATMMPDDHIWHLTNLDLGYFYWEAFDRETHHLQAVHVPWSFAISFGDFETKFLPATKKGV